MAAVSGRNLEMIESTQSLPESARPDHPAELPGRYRLRWRAGLCLLMIGITGTVLANRMAADNTNRMIHNFQGAGITILLMVVWWFVFSGVSLRLRIAIGVFVILLVAAIAGLTVRKVWFDGDMRPRLEFVWDPPSASEKAQKWLEANQPATGVSAATLADRPLQLEITDQDWPTYCGPGGNRVISEPLCSFNWNENPPKELWRRPVGDAWSSFTIVGTSLYTQEQRGEQECVVCYDANTGTEIWRREDPARYESAQGAVGPRATPAITAGAVFSLGATGILNALNPATGELLWQRNICRDAEADVLEWGMSGSPLIWNNTVIVDAGGTQNKAVIAYSVSDGSIVWANGNHKAGYSTPRIESIGGINQLLIFHGDGLAGMDPESGMLLWEYPWTNQYKINVAQPMKFDDQVFISSGYDSGCVLLDPTRLTNGRPAEVWPPNKNLKLKFNEAVQHGAFVYGLDDGILACIDVRTGERKWKGGRYRFGQLLLWGDRIVVQGESGAVAIVVATPEKHTEIARLEALSDRTWNVPVVNRKRLFVRNAAEAACYLLPD
jgi:outer membrane protein assembly factor BamB